MKGYVLTDNGQYQNGDSTDHDDTVMALGLAITATIYEADDDARPQTREGRGRHPQPTTDAERFLAATDGVVPGGEVVVKKVVKPNDAGELEEQDAQFLPARTIRGRAVDPDDEYLFDEYEGDPW